MEGSLVSLVPTIVVLISAVALKRSLEALIMGVFVGYLIIGEGDILSSFLNGITTSMGDETLRWIILVVALFGVFIGLITQSGGATAFVQSAVKLITSRTKVLLATWAMGLLIFIDDILMPW